MAIGTSKVGALGGLVPGGTETFNASGTFVVPPGVKKVSVTGQGGSGNPGNAGNPGNTGNAGKGGTGGGGAGTVTNPCTQRSGYPGGWGFNVAPLSYTNLTRPGGAGGKAINPAAARAPLPRSGRSGNAGTTGNAGNAGNPGNPGNTGTASTVFSIPFAGGNGGTGGAAGNAGNGGTGGVGGAGAPGAGGGGGNPGGGGAGGTSTPNFVADSPTIIYSYGGGGGGGAGVNTSGTAGVAVKIENAPPYNQDVGNIGGAGGKTAGFSVPGGPRAPFIVVGPPYTVNTNNTGPFDASMTGGQGGGQVSGNRCFFGGPQFSVGSPPPAPNYPGPPYPNGWPTVNAANGFTSFCGGRTFYRGVGIPNPLVNAVSCANPAMRSGSGGGGGATAIFARPCRGGGGGAGAGRGNAGNAGGAGGAGNPGNAGATNSPVPTNCVPVTPGASYPVVVGTSGQIVISWNPQ